MVEYIATPSVMQRQDYYETYLRSAYSQRLKPSSTSNPGLGVGFLGSHYSLFGAWKSSRRGAKYSKLTVPARTSIFFGKLHEASNHLSPRHLLIVSTGWSKSLDMSINVQELFRFRRRIPGTKAVPKEPYVGVGKREECPDYAKVGD